MKRSNYLTYGLLIALLALMTSCRQELCFNHFSAAAIGISWEHEWERDYGLAHQSNWSETAYGYLYDDLRPGRPEWVNIISFSESSTFYETFIDSDGGDIMVTEGEGQSFLLYNGDTQYLVIQDKAMASYARASATGRSRSSLEMAKEYYPDSRTTNPPDVIYSAYIPDVPPIGLHEKPEYAIKMQPLVYTYLVRYEFEHGIEHVALARGALGGMAESVYLIDGRTTDDTSVILYDCQIKPFGCEARVRSFGVPGFPDKYFGQKKSASGTGKPYTLNLEVKLKNGNFVNFDYDVSDQIENQPRGGVITIKGIRIEDDQNLSDAGFDIDVADWGEHVDIDLPVEPR